jgi:hypothetical protein
MSVHCCAASDAPTTASPHAFRCLVGDALGEPLTGQRSNSLPQSAVRLRRPRGFATKKVRRQYFAAQRIFSGIEFSA